MWIKMEGGRHEIIGEYIDGSEMNRASLEDAALCDGCEKMMERPTKMGWDDKGRKLPMTEQLMRKTDRSRRGVVGV